MLSAAIVLAVVALPVAPPEHLHRGGIEGRLEPLVHAHAWDVADAPPASGCTTLESSHGNHALAFCLSGDLATDSGGVAHTAGPLSTAMAVLTAPVRLGFVRRADACRIHAPPGTVQGTRGPPSRA